MGLMTDQLPINYLLLFKNKNKIQKGAISYKNGVEATKILVDGLKTLFSRQLRPIQRFKIFLFLLVGGKSVNPWILGRRDLYY